MLPEARAAGLKLQVQPFLQAGHVLLGVRHEQTHKHIAAIGRSAAELSSLRAHRQRGGIARDHALNGKMQRLCLLHRSGRDRLPFELTLACTRQGSVSAGQSSSCENGVSNVSATGQDCPCCK